MQGMVESGDLTARARIRNAALELFGEQGEGGSSLRTVAKRAGVTVGLVQHHFKTKEGLRESVEQLIVDYHAHAIAQVPDHGSPREVAAARDAAVRTMLESQPMVVNYLRRTLLDPHAADSKLLYRLTELSRAEVSRLRSAHLATTTRPEADQVINLMVRQLGQLFLQPMVDAMWTQLHGPDAQPSEKPSLKVTIRPTTEHQNHDL